MCSLPHLQPRSWRFGDKATYFLDSTGGGGDGGVGGGGGGGRYLHLDEAKQNPSSLTSVGVVYIPIVDQHLIKEDDTSIIGKRLLGKTG